MSLVRINWKPDVKERRKFGLAMLVGFGIITLVLYLRRHADAAQVCLVIGAVCGVLGLSGTVLAWPVYWVWMAIAFVMGNIMSRLILSVFYYLVITPVALVMRLFGRDRLRLKGKSVSYWMNVREMHSDWERQF